MVQDASRTADVLIIGGGLIGCSAAWRLAQAGAKVTVLDRSDPGGEASSAAAGMLAPIGEMLEPGALADLCISSLKLYPDFADELEQASGQQVGYRTGGTLLVALNEEQEQELSAFRARWAPAIEFRCQTAVEVQAIGLSASARGGMFIPSDHWVDNVRLMQALLVACRQAGVQVEPNCPVRRLNLTGTRIESVTAGNQLGFTANQYVLAAGCWSGEVAAQLDMPPLTAPCRGQMLEFECGRPLPFVVRSGIHYLVPRGDRVLLGTTSEYAGYAKAPTAEGMRSILQGVMRLVPFAGELRFVRAWAGLRPDTPDHLPILGYGEIENLVWATGHFRNGILLAPVTAEIIATLVMKGAIAHPIEMYRPARFVQNAARRRGSGEFTSP